MSDDEAPPPKPCTHPGTAPGWMVTFGDMMCLLMCFFVLLVAFSEMDIQRYRMIAGSMKMAFGVQREFRGMDVPKGVTLLASEFAKGKPAHSPKPLDKKNQIMDGMREAEAGKTDHDTARTEDIEVDTERIVEVLADEVESGIIHVEGLDDRIVIRIDENGIFRAGSATVNPDFRGLLTQLGLVLEDMNGTIAVGGHTDETPIKSTRFRSNWELSSSRAVSVIHVLLEETEIAPYRLLSQGFADSRPLVPNDTPENREMNRRVEISVLRTLDDSNLD